MILELRIILLLCTLSSLVNAQVNDTTRTQLNLKGAVQSIETKVIRYEFGGGIKRKSSKPVARANYEFSKEGAIISSSGKIPVRYKPNKDIGEIDSSIYQIDRSNDKNVIAYKKLSDTDTTNEYKIRYYEYNENNLLVTDSVRYGSYIETGFTEGPVITKFLYDDYGNVIYIWFKSSFVFAIWDHWLLEYTYDSNGNWIKMTKSIINETPAHRLSVKNLDGVDSTKEWTVERTIEYY